MISLSNSIGFLAVLYLLTIGTLPAVVGYGVLGLLVLLVIHASQTSTVVRSRLSLALPAIRLYGLLVFVALISGLVVLVNEMPTGSSIEAIARLLIGGVFLMAGASIDGARVGLFFRLVLIVIGFHSVIGILGYILGLAPVVGGVKRAAGFLTPNVYANLSTVGAVLAFGVLVSKDEASVGLRRFAFACLLVFLAAIALSATLKNVVILIPVLVLVYFIAGGRRVEHKMFGGVLIGLVALLALVAVDPIRDRVISTVESGLSIGYVDGADRPSSFQWRVMHWIALFEEWQEKYLLLGAGIGQVENLGGARAHFGGPGTLAHNDWLSLLIEYGLVFFTIVIVFFVGVWRLIWSSGVYLGVGRVVLIGVFSSMVVLMLGGNVLYTAGYLYVFWFMMGALVGVSSLKSEGV